MKAQLLMVIGLIVFFGTSAKAQSNAPDYTVTHSGGTTIFTAVDGSDVQTAEGPFNAFNKAQDLIDQGSRLVCEGYTCHASDIYVDVLEIEDNRAPGETPGNSGASSDSGGGYSTGSVSSNIGNFCLKIYGCASGDAY